MINKRNAEDRGRTDLGWLDSRHTFSFGGYHDPENVYFRSLRVINEDRVQPGRGFGTHPHQDMEILTYVLDGALEHEDSTGSKSVIRPGVLQHMSAGTGITHSEYNASQIDPVHFFQIWIMPEEKGIKPVYNELPFELEENVVSLLASPNGQDGSLLINQDVRLYTVRLGHAGTISHELGNGRHAWVQVARGEIALNGVVLSAGDGAAVSDEKLLEIKSEVAAEVLVFDLG